MPRVESEIEVEAPLTTVYNQWTQFETFPEFMEGVTEVRQIDPRRLYWKAEIGGRVAEWEAEIDRQEPDEVISWHSVGGKGMDGVVTFQPAGEGRTRVHLDIEYEASVMERIGDVLGIVEGRVEGDLERFKEFIETRRQETGAWRGSIHSAEIRDGHPVDTDERGERSREMREGTVREPDGTIKTHYDEERERAEQRQAGAVDGPQAGPGGGPID